MWVDACIAPHCLPAPTAYHASMCQMAAAEQMIIALLVAAREGGKGGQGGRAGMQAEIGNVCSTT